jgi:hypothetical protein
MMNMICQSKHLEKVLPLTGRLETINKIIIFQAESAFAATQ